MLFIVALLLLLTVSLLATRVATVALVHTGLSRESARFQARSAFTGAGFTTAESEQVVGHPVRRRIVMLLMLWGNAGMVTGISSVILSFVSEDSSSPLLRLTLLAAGLVVLLIFANSTWADRHLSRLIDKALRKYTSLDVRDYASLMQLVGDYRLVEMKVAPEDWIAGKALCDIALRDEGIIVLGVQRASGIYVGAPNGDTVIEANDILILYGRVAALESLDRRIKNMTAELRHERAVIEQQRLRKEEERMDHEASGVFRVGASAPEASARNGGSGSR